MMAFYIDICTGQDRISGERKIIQVEHTYKKCLESGWYNPETKTWQREFVEAPVCEEILFPNYPIKDPNYGKKFC